MAKFQVIHGKAGVPQRFWGTEVLDDSVPAEKQKLDEARKDKLPVRPL